MRNLSIYLVVLMFIDIGAFSQTIPLDPARFDAYGVSLKTDFYKGKQALVVEQSIDSDSNSHYTFARIKDIDFHNGTIEVNLAGQPKKTAVEGARGFVGIAFRVPEDTSKFEVFYLRPTNGQANDQVRRNHSVQYISYPGFPWPKLRKETPEKYESYADLVPGEWTNVKIEVKDETANLYLNGAEQPTLIVNDLKQGKVLRGSIGLWIAIGTQAWFADLKIIKRN